MSPLFAILLAATAQGAQANAQWTERYFGVGSAEERGLACEQARGHADGNSTQACVEKRGTRAEAAYTECICSHLAEGDHVCNVNLKVVCDAASASGATIRSGGGGSRGGEPKGRAGRSSTGRGPRARRGGPGLSGSDPEAQPWNEALR